MTLQIGTGRTILIVLLALIVVALGGARLLLFGPASESLAQQRAGLERSVATLRRDVDRADATLATLQRDWVRYEAVEADGFLDRQERLEAGARLDALAQAAGLNGLLYTFRPQQTLEMDGTAPAGRRLTMTPLEIDLFGPLDGTVLAFADGLDAALPGRVVLREVTVDRLLPVTPAALEALAQGQPVDFVRGRVRAEWYALVLEEGR